MNINLAVLGQFMMIIVPLVCILSYFLGRKKTKSPILAALLGLILCAVPPFAMLYLLILMFKKDVTPSPAVAAK